MPEFQFENLADFLAMGGYAQYVWPVYILFALFFVITVIPPLSGRKKILKQLQSRMDRRQSTDPAEESVSENHQ